MGAITSNEMDFVLGIFKSPETEYNSNSIAKRLGLSSMGALKIAKRLEKEGIFVSKELGRAKFYRLNFANNYAKDYVRFLLKREREHAAPYVKMWIGEIKKLKSADAAILFGSVLKKHHDAGDIDVVLMTDKKRFPKLKKEIDEVNQLNIKKIHPVYQTKEDFIINLAKQDKIILGAIKGIVVFGEDIIVDALRK